MLGDVFQLPSIHNFYYWGIKHRKLMAVCFKPQNQIELREKKTIKLSYPLNVWCVMCSVFVEVDWFHSFFLYLSLLLFFHKTASFVGIPLSGLISLYSACTSKQLIFPVIFVQRCMLLIYFVFFLSRSLLAVHFHMAHFFFVRIKIAAIEFQHTDRPTDSCAANFLFRSFMLLFFLVIFEGMKFGASYCNDK